jgi:hypothetical protein
VPERNFPSEKDFRMIAFKRRLVESLDLASMEEVQQMKTSEVGKTLG